MYHPLHEEKHLCGPGPRILVWSHTKREERRERREKREKMEKREEKREKANSCVCDQTKILGQGPHKIFYASMAFTTKNIYLFITPNSC
jgi:hypothetical protein